MRVTFILPTVDMSGGTRVISIYANALIKMGHDVCVVSPPPKTIPLGKKLKLWLKEQRWPPNSAPISHLDNCRFVHRVLDRWRPINDSDVPDGDVVIATWWETAEWVNALNATKGAKVYFIQHHEIFPYLPVARCQATYRMPLHKVVVAPWLKRVMVEHYGDNVVDVVPNSVNRAQFFAPIRDKQSVPTVGFVYSPAPFKGLDVTLAAVAAVRAKMPNLSIISFGSRPTIRELRLPERAEFHILPPQDQLRNLYARCDVWVSASRSEGFNLPALEAMACRTPVVATRTGWPADEIRSGWNGILVDVDDQMGLSDGTEWVLSRSDEDWKNLSMNAYRTSCAGSWEESAGMFEKALVHACCRAERGEI